MTVNELLDLLFRWAHLIAGIMWIGNSMLFNWLDRNLIEGEGGRLSRGKVFMVHSGAFYEVEKKLLEPGELPRQLHWFKWQNFATWSTGISLLVVVYYLNGAAFLIDPRVRDLEPAAAIAISAGSLVAAWAVYDAIWRLLGDRHARVAAALSFAGLLGAAYGFTLVFSGRAAYIQTGVLMGTMMTGNVWMRILPSQRQLIAATKAGEEQDAVLSVRAKQRSIHNNYLTFPLLFIMLSSHFPSTYGHHFNWLLLFLVMFGGAGVRHFMNVRYDGKAWLLPAIATGLVAVVGVMGVTRIETAPAARAEHAVDYARAQEIIVTRCVSCHSKYPSDDIFKVPPGGVMFDTAEQIAGMVPRIKERAVMQRTMPFNNKTGMTEEERGELLRWIEDGASQK